ncbi:DUF3298 and DUF4163 domain-containing protein [Paenibacillus abyssi]|uniref:DUF3298 domain-containing protein n=1 Tax=Paenibacillus abyssi TaxID=1340531 RepID=A0A917CLF5_9BACL|nr:DUF3298 and DUF4163 domain-containing protein [Paenibacillus abyssi]GGF90109.1 hypothetical protein GCM10010916_04350 [Paenibacillus abyssi]
MVFTPPAVIQPSRLTYPKTELWLPIVSGITDHAARNRINETIRRSASQLVAKQGPLSDPRAEMLGWFEVKTNQKSVLSLSLFNYAYTGGAHGLTLQLSLTLDQMTGRQYSLSQLFKPGSEYVKRLSAIIAQQITRRDVPVLQPFVSIRPDQDYYVADRSLVVYFQLYELTPYVYGFAYFPISVYDIQDIVNENGPLAPMIVND